MDNKATIEELKNLVKQFCEDRDWDQFHNPKDLAIGIATECGADVGVAFSGLAGPTGGTLENPVGTVCIGLFVAGKLATFKKHFDGSRSDIRSKSVDFAINKLIELLQN